MGRDASVDDRPEYLAIWLWELLDELTFYTRTLSMKTCLFVGVHTIPLALQPGSFDELVSLLASELLEG